MGNSEPIDSVEKLIMLGCKERGYEKATEQQGSNDWIEQDQGDFIREISEEDSDKEDDKITLILFLNNTQHYSHGCFRK